MRREPVSSTPTRSANGGRTMSIQWSRRLRVRTRKEPNAGICEFPGSLDEITYKTVHPPELLGAPRPRSPFAIVLMFVAIVLCLMTLVNFSLGLLSSIRAYVGGESLWSKAQKDAVFHLQIYATSRAPDELRQFRSEIAVPMGDHEARVEMDKPSPDSRKVRD